MSFISLIVSLYLSYNPFLIFQIMNSTSNLTLFEGHPGEHLKIFSTVPPRVLGRSLLSGDPLSWKIILKISTEVFDSAMKCPNNVTLHQVVTAWHHNGQPIKQLTCNAEINETNWHLPYTVTVKAVSDNKFDGNKTGYFNIFAVFKSNTTTRNSENIAKLKVIFILFFLLLLTNCNYTCTFTV